MAVSSSFFFFNDTATTEIYTLSLHDALPISLCGDAVNVMVEFGGSAASHVEPARSEEHTSELQSQSNLVCRLLLEKKKSDRPPLRTRAVHAVVATRLRDGLRQALLYDHVTAR